MTHEALEEYDAAIAAFRRALQIDPQNPFISALLCRAHAARGDAAEAQRLFQAAENHGARGTLDPAWVAAAAAGLGDTERALEWLQKAFEARTEGLALIKVDPKFDRLRADARFGTLLTRLNLAR